MAIRRKNKARLVPLVAIPRFLVVLACTTIFAVDDSFAMGEKFAEQGHLLAAEIYKELIQRGFCGDPGSCNKLLPIYGGHGNRVNFSTYGISEKNREALSVVVSLIVRRGIVITQGVPIGFVAYAKPHEDYVNQGLFRSKEPILTLEVNK